MELRKEIKRQINEGIQEKGIIPFYLQIGTELILSALIIFLTWKIVTFLIWSALFLGGCIAE